MNKPNKKEIVAVDYKGKHFILYDKDMVDELYIIDPYIDVAKVLENLEDHVEQCRYYGIPAYVGKDRELKEKIEELFNKSEPNE